MTDLSDRLRRLLDARGLTFREAAQLADMPHQQVWRICSGKVPNPRIETVKRLVEALGSTMAEIYTAEN